MIRAFLIVLAAGIVVIGIAMVYFGAFPPTPTPHHVERTVPNDQIKGP